MAMRLSYVVARGNIYGATPRGTSVYTGENYSEVGSPAKLYDSPGPYFTTFILHRAAANLGCWCASCGSTFPRRRI